MELIIKNVRGLDAAEIEINPVALVCGLNGAGKSSLSTAIAACLTRNPAPLPGMAKNEARQLLRDGAQRGKATLAGELGAVTVNWPGGAVNADEQSPAGSDIAAGMESLATMPAKKRAAFLVDALQAEPTLDDLRAALEAVGIAGTTVDKVWESIAEHGWDAAHKRAIDAGARAKGGWEQITGEAYGSKKADDWMPAGLATTDAEELGAAVAEAQQALDAVIGQQAVGQAEIARLKELAAGEKGAAGAVKAAEKLITTLEGVLGDAEQTLRDAQQTEQHARQVAHAAPKPGQAEATVPCPACNAPLVPLSKTAIRLPNPAPDEEENAARQCAIDVALEQVDEAVNARQAAEQAVADCSRELDAARRELSSHQRQLAGAQQAAEQLANAETDGATPEQVQEARDAVQAAEQALIDLQRYHDAGARHAAIVRNQEIIALLAPTGLRQQVLSKVLIELRQQLADICTAAGWKMIDVTDDLSVNAAGKPYALLSTGEQFRCRVALQLVFAGRDGSAMVVVDAADVLDKPGRNGLFRAIHYSGMPAVVTMTYNSPEEVPASREGLNTYWIEAATAEKIER